MKKDPSAIDNVKGRYIREMQNLNAGYDPAVTYVVRVPVYYADYDPETEAFPLKSKIKGGTELSITERVVSARASDTPELSVREIDPYPGRFNVSFSADPQQDLPLSGIPLPQDETREVMQSRNASRGYNRQAMAKIEFRILGLKLGEELPRFEARITDIRYEI